jgi:hypothetical protein
VGRLGGHPSSWFSKGAAAPSFNPESSDLIVLTELTELPEWVTEYQTALKNPFASGRMFFS